MKIRQTHENESSESANATNSKRWLLFLLLTVLLGEILAIRFLHGKDWFVASDNERLFAIGSIALIPLVTALVIVFRKRIQISSLLLATLLVGLFLSLWVNPILKAYDSRSVARNLTILGAEFFIDSGMSMSWDRNEVYQWHPYRDSDLELDEQWIDKLPFISLSQLKNHEIQTIKFNQPEHFIASGVMKDCRNLKVVCVDTAGVSDRLLQQFLHDLKESNARTIVLSGATSTQLDMQFLSGNQHIEMIWIHQTDNLSELYSVEIPSLESVAIFPLKSLDSAAFSDSDNVAHIKNIMLWGTLEELDGSPLKLANLAAFKNLETLDLVVPKPAHFGQNDFSQLANVDSLRNLILRGQLSSENFNQLKTLKQLTLLHSIGSSRKDNGEISKSLRTSLPGCMVVVE